MAWWAGARGGCGVWSRVDDGVGMGGVSHRGWLFVGAVVNAGMQVRRSLELVCPAKVFSHPFHSSAALVTPRWGQVVHLHDRSVSLPAQLQSLVGCMIGPCHGCTAAEDGGACGHHAGFNHYT